MDVCSGDSSIRGQAAYKAVRPISTADSSVAASQAQPFGKSLTSAIEQSAAQTSEEPAQIAPPGGGKSAASDLMRLLGGNTEGVNASSSPNGQPTNRPSFFSEVMNKMGGKPDDEEENNDFARYMHGMIAAAYASPPNAVDTAPVLSE